MNEFVRLFDELSAPKDHADETALRAVRLSNRSAAYLCKNFKRQPVVLLSLDEVNGDALVNYSLQYLRIEHNLSCRVQDQEGSIHSGQYTLLCCLSSERGIQEYFLHVVYMLVKALPEKPAAAEVVEAIEKLITLFLAMSQPQKTDIVGLWGELFLIVNAKDPLFLLKAWHEEAGEEIDFSIGDQRLEVKCSSTDIRKHHFSLDQVYPPDGIRQVVASILITGSVSGKGLKELWDEVRAIAAGDMDLLYKVERVCSGILGSNWHAASDWRYDEKRARESLQFFDVSSIPKPSQKLSKGVSEVNFCSDLSHGHALDTNALRDMGSLFSSSFF